jgi:hypothetical protein
MTGETRAAIGAAKKACAEAIARHRERDRAAMLARIAGKWKAAAGLPRIPGNDPLVALGVIALWATPYSTGSASAWRSPRLTRLRRSQGSVELALLVKE